MTRHRAPRWATPIAVGLVLGLAAPAAAQDPPDTTITSGPPAFTNSPGASFTFEGTGDSFECQRDAGDFFGCTSPFEIDSVAEGVHTLAVRARVTATGAVDPSPATHTWTVDFSPPDTVLTTHPPAATSSTSATFEFSSPDASAGFECSLNGSEFAGCSSPVIYQGLSEGERTFSVRARDPATNLDGTPPSFTWRVDFTPPDTAITDGPGALTSVKNPALSFTATEPGSTFECSVNGGAFAACGSPHVMEAQADGAITFAVRAKDTLDNTDATPAERAWTQDTVPPARPRLRIFPRGRGQDRVSLTGPTAPFQRGTALRARWGLPVKSSAGHVSYDVETRYAFAGVSLDGVPYKPKETDTLAVARNFTPAPGSTLCVSVRAGDAAGNHSQWRSRCTTIPFRARDAYWRAPWKKRRGNDYFARQHLLRTGNAADHWSQAVRLQISPVDDPAGFVFGFQSAQVKRVALIVTKCPSCGALRVAVIRGSHVPHDPDDIAHQEVISLHSNRVRRRMLVPVHTFDVVDPLVRLVRVTPVGNGPRRLEGIGVSAR